jgi:hypothetical protein
MKETPEASLSHNGLRPWEERSAAPLLWSSCKGHRIMIYADRIGRGSLWNGWGSVLEPIEAPARESATIYLGDRRLARSALI